MDNLSDDARFSTQLEGKKLTGFGARFGKIFSYFIEDSKGIAAGMELDDERGIHAEEIFFDDIGQEIEEKKKRNAMMLANKNIKDGQKISALKSRKTKAAKDENSPENAEAAPNKEEQQSSVSDPKKEIEQIRESAVVKTEALTEQKVQQDVAQGKTPNQEMQKNREAVIIQNDPSMQQLPLDLGVKATPAVDNLQMDKALKTKPEPSADLQVQQTDAPAKGSANLLKSLLNAVLPTQLPDVREGGKGQGGPAV